MKNLTRGAWHDLWFGGLICGALVIGFAIVNALTMLSDMPHLSAWEPWIWEATSAASVMLFIALPWSGTRLFPLGWLNDGWPSRMRFIAGHLAFSLLWCLVHVSLMVALRHVIYGLMGQGYEFGPWLERLVYEYRKDLLSYGLFTVIFWGVRSLREAQETPLRPVSFDIRDGTRLIRAPLVDILAVTSAGNYVEFVLRDGRRPLMRATLVAVEGELTHCGFVRTHRSWLVNSHCLTGLRPQGSGDWIIELGATEAPLSRRFSLALDRLRQHPSFQES